MFQFFLSSIRLGVRGRSFYAVFLLGVGLMIAAYLTGYFSPRQPKTVALDVGFSGLRFAVVLLGSLWVQEMIGNEIGRKTVWFSLTYPVSRHAYLAGRFLGVVALIGLACIVMGLLLWLVVFAAGGAYEQEFPVRLGATYWLTVLGFWLDAVVVSSFALWIASLSTVTFLPFILGLAFAVGGKALGAVMDYLGRGADGDAELVARFDPLIFAIKWVLPDLSRLDWRSWPMYAAPPDHASVVLACAMALAYIGLMVGVAVIAFSRREFS
jgi:Cu-processing system permease protein